LARIRGWRWRAASRCNRPKLKGEGSMTKGLSTVGAIIAAIAVSVSASTTSVSSPLNVTNSQFAGNEESLGMDSTGTLLAASWNDWHYNDGCGFTYSTDGGTTWAPQT